jgi:two-component system chemotaxis response regulator CheY
MCIVRKKSILIVDDSIVVRAALRAALANHGFDVICASGGKEALNCVQQGVAIDLIVTDFNMPDLDGDRLIEQLRHTPQARRTPILVLTGGMDQHAKDSARRAGATGWIQKPFDTGKLVEAINKLAA